MNRLPSTQPGFAAVSAIFLLVALAALGGFMLTFSNAQQITSAQDIRGSRAYWAARTGLEWGIGSINGQPPATAACPAASSTLSGLDGGMNVVVSCDQQNYNEGGMDKKLFQLTAVASGGSAVGSTGFVERSVSASIEK